MASVGAFGHSDGSACVQWWSFCLADPRPPSRETLRQPIDADIRRSDANAGRLRMERNGRSGAVVGSTRSHLRTTPVHVDQSAWRPSIGRGCCGRDAARIGQDRPAGAPWNVAESPPEPAGAADPARKRPLRRPTCRPRPGGPRQRASVRGCDELPVHQAELARPAPSQLDAG